jgi:hypothetical protein
MRGLWNRIEEKTSKRESRELNNVEEGPMSSVERNVVYFEKAGEQNTGTLLKIVKEYAKNEGIGDIVVASTTGRTGAKAAKMLKGWNVVVVAHCFGFKEPGKSELEEEFERKIVANGAKIFVGTHALSSAERAVRKNFGTIQPLEIMANVLRRMGEGTKVCVEITLMAADAGLLRPNRDIIAIGGTGRGADTALRVHSANSARFFDLKIREVIAKPRDF